MNLRDLRLDLNKTQQQIADTCGISRKTWIDYESGKRMASFHVVKMLHNIYKIPYPTLISVCVSTYKG